LQGLLHAALEHDKAEDARAPIAPLLLLAATTGMRSGELRGLRWREVDLEAAEIRLPAARVKTKAARTITLRETPKALALLTALRLRVPGEFVFPALQATQVCEAVLESVRQRFDGPRVTLHALRRTAGTVHTCGNLYGGASAFMSAKKLGHAVAIAERLYVGVLSDLPKDATTFEAACGIEEIAQSIVASVGAVVAEASAATAAG
jgi:integrase